MIERYFIRWNGSETEGYPEHSGMMQASHGIDIDNLPNNWKEFVRTDKPNLSAVIKVIDGPSYYLNADDGKVYESYVERDMTTEERAAHDTFMSTQQPYDSWTYDTTQGVWVPPVSRPTDGSFYDWDEPSETWVLSPNNPT
jgi:hypothetical protein